MASYRVSDIYSCIQGEGVQAGTAMVLLRLQGCLVGCPWCDTKHTWSTNVAFQVATISEALGETECFAVVSEEVIVDYICHHHPGPRWVLVTGGEPAAQELGPLVSSLHEAGYNVALETSGTETGHLSADFNWVCVSPKINMPGGKPILPEAVVVADELKFVVGRSSDIAVLDEFLTTIPLKENAQICLQPLSMNKAATALCIKTVQERGWRLSVQLHKYLDQR